VPPSPLLLHIKMESLATAWIHLTSNYMFQTSNYVLYIYDHMLTFDEEVEKIWKQPFTFASLLFYINRYITHCQFIILQVEFHETTWTHSMCNRYVRFGGATTACLVVIADLILIMRVYALYFANKKVLAFLLTLLVFQVAFIGVGLHFGMPVPLPDGWPGCVLTGSNQWITALWIAPLVTDGCIFALTLYKTITHTKQYGQLSTIQIIRRDGIMYFAIIFSLNLMNVLIYYLAVEDLKAVGASISQILTSILISRLQLNLRRGRSDSKSQNSNPTGRLSGDRSASRRKAQTETAFFSVGNLGEELEYKDSQQNSYASWNSDGIRVDEIQLRILNPQRSFLAA